MPLPQDYNPELFNAVIVLGATATGKTAYAVNFAKKNNGEIISVDSRQVYKNLDLGTGKDLFEYDGVPYHLIDACTLEKEYNVFDFQNDAYKAFNDISDRNKLPVFAGGTGLYLDALIRKYTLVPVPINENLRKTFDTKTLEELQQILFSFKEKDNVHNKTDLEQRDRLIRAIEIAEYNTKNPEVSLQIKKNRPNIRPHIIGLHFQREILRKRIYSRLLERINSGMIEEVASINQNGISWKKLESLGLEYKFTAQFLQNKFDSKEEYIESLFRAICKFAKRQETWFRRMEKNGVLIQWIELS